MKKFIIAIVFALMSITSFGQISKVGGCYEFKLGEYVLTTSHLYWDDAYQEVVHTLFTSDLKYTSEENYALRDFIKKNKETIEERFGIVIESVNCDNHLIFVKLSRVKDLKAKNEREEYEKIVAERQKSERLNSLNNIF